MRVLAIDDEAQIRRLLEIALGGRGWEVFSSATGFEGLQAAGSCKPDVVLLDLNLPDMSGAEALGRLREWSTVPVVVVSVRDSEEDIVALLNAGADDYVTKPFYTNELAARIEAVHRRRAPERGGALATGRLRIDRDTREVLVAGEKARLTPTEYALLELLARNMGRIVTRDRILREVWGPAGESEEGNLRVFVNALRKKIEAEPARPSLLVTEAGVGYRLLALPPEGEP
ncbi:MAG TPA: response regulator transcription factor [Spirochaetales bacterium]|nr:response regulator transcription factor [Spirochaetales bacterium]HRY54692.1 response regulator transcription factor [Spirochaetia bacterium]HRZ63334.1 response regulator transcription factor [Spirochaetia bacterium]